MFWFFFTSAYLYRRRRPDHLQLRIPPSKSVISLASASTRSWYRRRAADSPLSAGASASAATSVSGRSSSRPQRRAFHCIYVKLRMEMPRNVGLMLIPPQRLRSTRIGLGMPAQGWERASAEMTSPVSGVKKPDCAGYTTGEVQ